MFNHIVLLVVFSIKISYIVALIHSINFSLHEKKYTCYTAIDYQLQHMVTKQHRRWY